jgi:hypothetical protein
MTPFGKGLLLGMFVATVILSMKHSGVDGWQIVVAIAVIAVILTCIPDKWVRGRS